MKATFKILFIALSVIMTTVSCNHKDYPDVSDKVQLSAIIPYSGTKGTATSTSGIMDIDTDEIVEISLARIDQNYAGDPLYPSFVNCGDKLEANMHRPDASNGYKRDIEFVSEAQYFLDDANAIRYASWFPADGVYHTTSDSTFIEFPIDGETDVMYGNVAVGRKSTPFNPIVFNHALCVFRFYVYAMISPEDEGAEENVGTRWGGLTYFALGNMPESCTLRLPLDDGETYNLSYSSTIDSIRISDPANNIYYNPGDTLPLGIANRRYVAKCIAAPPADGVLDIFLKTQRASASQEISIARNFKAGCAYDIILRFSDHGFINAEVSIGEWDTFEEEIDKKAGVNMYYNLSTYGTANCYMINSGNYGYSFDGTVMGNGDGSAVGVSNTTISPGYVDIIWSDMPEVSLDLTDDDVNNPIDVPTVSLVSNELSQGKVLLYVQGNPSNERDKALLSEGNVIIGAFADDTKTDTLWTWHIWVTDRVKTQGYTNGYTVQDRNLGAISDSREGADYSGMYGLYYQWGRPSPFPDPSKGHSTLGLSPATTTVSNAIAHPNTLFGTGNTTDNDWLSPGNPKANNLWGWTSDATDPVKTIYDPCPFGYMVSDSRMWKNMSDYEKQGTFVFDYNEDGGVNVSIIVFGILSKGILM